MCYNDIVNSRENPFSGHIYRSIEHDFDVFPGNENINYQGIEVNTKNFLNVLTADNPSEKAVLHSTSDDDVFIFYENHGGDDVLGVPDNCGDFIFSNDLIQAFTKMAQKKMFRNLFFMISASYSGSVGEDIANALEKENIKNVYIQTSTNNDQTSYSTIYDAQLGVFLAEEYSIIKDNFLEMFDLSKKTIGDLYNYCAENVPTSTVCEYGDLSLKSLPLSYFFGNNNDKKFKQKCDLHEQLKVDSTKAIKKEIRLILENEKDENKRLRLKILLTSEKIKDHNLNNIISNLKISSYKKYNYQDFINSLLQQYGTLGESFYRESFNIRKYVSKQKL